MFWTLTVTKIQYSSGNLIVLSAHVDKGYRGGLSSQITYRSPTTRESETRGFYSMSHLGISTVTVERVFILSFPVGLVQSFR